MNERIFATYFIETALPLERAIETIAGEQSSGTFVAVPGETSQLQARHRARVENIEKLETDSQTPALRGGRGDGPLQRALHAFFSVREYRF